MWAPQEPCARVGGSIIKCVCCSNTIGVACGGVPGVRQRGGHHGADQRFGGLVLMGWGGETGDDLLLFIDGL